MKKVKTFFPLGKEVEGGGSLANNLLQPVLLFSLGSHTVSAAGLQKLPHQSHPPCHFYIKLSL